MSRTANRVLALLALLAFAALSSPHQLAAHQTLRSSQPARGETLQAPPRTLRLTFVEPVNLALTRLLLLGPAGDTIRLEQLRVHADSGTVLLADVDGAQRAGAYRIEWRTVGRDGHVVAGTIAYTLETADAPASVELPLIDTAALPTTMPAQDRPDSGIAGGAGAAGVVAQWLRLLALLLVIGSTSAAILLLRDRRTADASGLTGEHRVAAGSASAESKAVAGDGGTAQSGVGGQVPAFLPGAPARAALIGLGAALVLLAAALVRLRSQLGDVAAVAPGTGAGERATMILGSFWGVAWMLEMAGALIALLGFIVVRRTGRAWWLPVVGSLVLAASAATSGHSAAGDVPLLTVPLDALHVLGAAGWLGTLAVLVAVALPLLMRLPAPERGTRALALFRAFSPFALTCAAIVVATGVAAAALHLGSFAALWQTTYGRTLMVKIGVVVLLVALGAWNWRRASPRLTTDPRGVEKLRGSATLEVAIAAVIVLITAALIVTPVPRG